MAHAPFANPPHSGRASTAGMLSRPIIMAAGLLGSAGMLAAAIVVFAPPPQGMPAPAYQVTTGQTDKAVTAPAAAVALRGTEHEKEPGRTAAAHSAAHGQARSSAQMNPGRPPPGSGNQGEQTLAAAPTAMPPAASDRTAMIPPAATGRSRSLQVDTRGSGFVTVGANVDVSPPASSGAGDATAAATQENNRTAPVVVTAQRRQFDTPAANIDRVSRGNTVVIQLPRKG